MDIDLTLAISHHVVVFLLVAILAAEFVLLRPGLAGQGIGQLARIDAAYAVPEAEIAGGRRYIHLQVGVLILIPIFAAAMARGYGI